MQYLYRLTDQKATVKPKQLILPHRFALVGVCINALQDSGHDIAEKVTMFEDLAWGWSDFFNINPIPSGLTKDDTLVLHTRVRVLKV